MDTGIRHAAGALGGVYFTSIIYAGVLAAIRALKTVGLGVHTVNKLNLLSF